MKYLKEKGMECPNLYLSANLNLLAQVTNHSISMLLKWREEADQHFQMSNVCSSVSMIVGAQILEI